MGYMISFIIQLFVFFLIVSSIGTLFVKATKSTAVEQNLDSDPAANDNERVSNNRDHLSDQRRNKRPDRQKQPDRRTARERYSRGHTQKAMKEVVTLSPTKKKRKVRGQKGLNRKNLKQAVIYKEILDKPLSMRDE
ncbi:hypothetical protein ADIAL_0960 [Alkalibacterium sp. AK22]|uniref:hypothetical protein n=1 Tax=Alkalibacterium sp. AK22 TaxID=1229520 RepID=UPI0004468840|nr:hypothetical protein [Alkalibacterium sp. AK22]EXJ23523.1 hypothetical protein ADIAL_0960 [Alkalibacterium sp. AK22]